MFQQPPHSMGQLQSDAELALRLQQQMDVENEQCELDRTMAAMLAGGDIQEHLQTKATLTDQQVSELDPEAVREDIYHRTFTCPVMQETMSKDQGQCVGLWHAKRCNHWVSTEALTGHVHARISDRPDASAVPCPQCLAEPCSKCEVHGELQPVGGKRVCCVPERQVRTFLTPEETIKVSHYEFNRYREANQSSMVQCPKGCDYWCELEDEDEPQQLQQQASHAGSVYSNAGGPDEDFDYYNPNAANGGYGGHQGNGFGHGGGYGGLQGGSYFNSGAAAPYGGGGYGGYMAAGAHGGGTTRHGGYGGYNGGYGGGLQQYGGGMYGHGQNASGYQHWNVQHDPYANFGGASTSAGAVGYEDDGPMHAQYAQNQYGVAPAAPTPAGSTAPSVAGSTAQKPPDASTPKIQKGQVMYCEMCSHSFCLYCSKQVGAPVHAHGEQKCANVLHKHRSKARKIARKRRGAERSQQNTKGIYWQACPGCKMQAFKGEGECNSVTCKCGVEFCFLCGEDITIVSHEHFNDQFAACYQKCFHRPDGGRDGKPPCMCGAQGCLQPPAEPDF